MDAALKRSRSEEPADLPPPSARDLEEEEEEEGMEPALEEEEEVDPRIQGELEKLNQSTDDINRRETELELEDDCWRPLRGVEQPPADRIKCTAEPSVWVEHMWILFHMVFIMGAPWGQTQGLCGALKFMCLWKSVKGLRGELPALYNGQERMS